MADSTVCESMQTIEINFEALNHEGGISHLIAQKADHQMGAKPVVNKLFKFVSHYPGCKPPLLRPLSFNIDKCILIYRRKC